MFEHGSPLCQSVDLRSSDLCVSVGFQMICSQGVDGDEDYVPRLRVLGEKRNRVEPRQDQQGGNTISEGHQICSGQSLTEAEQVINADIRVPVLAPPVLIALLFYCSTVRLVDCSIVLLFSSV